MAAHRGAPGMAVSTGGQKRRRKKKYRLKPAAKRFYKRLLLFLGVVAAVALVIKLLPFQKSVTLGDFRANEPFALAPQILEAMGLESSKNLAILDVSYQADNKAIVTEVQMQLVQLLEEDKCQNWTLEIKSKKARLIKGEKLNANLSTQLERYPALEETLTALSHTPIMKLATDNAIGTKKHFEFDAGEYNPNVSPQFASRVGQGVHVLWVSAAGTTSPVEADFKANTRYIAVDCSVAPNDESTPPALYAILLLEAP